MAPIDYQPEVMPSCNETGTCQTGFDNTSEIWRTLMAVYLGAILILSVAFNGALCLVFYKKPHLLSISNCFVLNLACCQLCMALLVLPFSLFAVVSHNWVYSGPWCEIQGFLSTVVIVTLQFALLTVSLDRNYAIMNSLRYPNVFTQSLCTFLIGISWVSAVIISVPPLLHSGFGSYTFHPHQFLCTLDWTTKSSYIFVFFILAFAVPILIQSFCYIKIFGAAFGHSKRSGRVHPWATKSSSRSFREGNSDSSDSSESYTSEPVRYNATECKAVRTILILAVAYSVCWVPYFIDSFFVLIQGLALPHLSAASICFMFSTGILNPVIYAYMNRVTRRQIGRFLCGNLDLNDSDDFVSTSMSTKHSSSTRVTQHRMRSRSTGGPNNEMDTILEETEIDSGICEVERHIAQRRDSTSDHSTGFPVRKATEILLTAENLVDIAPKTTDVNKSTNETSFIKDDNTEGTGSCSSETVTRIKTDRKSHHSPWNIIRTDRFCDEKKRTTRSKSEVYFTKGKRRKKRDCGSFLFFENDISAVQGAHTSSNTVNGTRRHENISVDHVQSISLTTVPRLLKFQLSVTDTDGDETENKLTVKSNFHINTESSGSDFADSKTSTDQCIRTFDNVSTATIKKTKKASTDSSNDLDKRNSLSDTNFYHNATETDPPIGSTSQTPVVKLQVELPNHATGEFS